VGASVRVVRAARDEGGSDAAHRQALARQLAAVDSARGTETRSRQSATASGRSAERRSATRRARPRSAVDPNARADSAERAIVDMDVASEGEIESLPRIGSVLARRIVGDRSANGPFGSLEGLQRVRGVGPGLATLLRERVTFSGTARPSNAVVDPRLRSAPPSSRSTRRGRSQ
jgi:competence protein ComEA